MNVSPSDLSEGIVLYLGFGKERSPCEDSVGLVAEFGKEKASFIENKIVGLINEANSIQINWDVNSLSSAGKEVHELIRRNHPQLSEQALRAIEWKFTFDWR